MNSIVKRVSVPRYVFDYKDNSSSLSSAVNHKYMNSVIAVYENEPNTVKMPHYYDSREHSINDGGLIIRSGIIVSSVSILSVETAVLTNGYNDQTLRYVSAINEKQALLNQSNQDFLNQKYASGEPLNATAVRNKADWQAVKRLVIRDELMKLQIGDVTDLPLSQSDIALIKEQISGTDLSDYTDAELTNIIDSIMKPDERACLAAFKAFKEDGVVNEYFQQDKLEQLAEHLNGIDVDKITAEQFKKLMDNFWEKLKVHHRTSISEDPTKQNDIDNLDTLSTSEHGAKHTDPETDKINYKRPLKEEALDRQTELEKLNKKRVLRNELKGLGITLAIAAGTGFTIGFIISLAKTGISPHCLKNAFVAGGKSSLESSGMAAVGYGIARTVGGKLSRALSDIIASKIGENVAEETLNNISKMCTMGVVGTLTIVVSTVYQFVRFKMAGFSTKESLIRAGKSAALSAGMLALAITAQGIWGGPAGMIVSISAGIIMTGVNVVTIIHDKNIRCKIQVYLIQLSFPTKYSFA